MANAIIRTPVGKAQWAHLTVPDTKFNPDGEYKVKLVLDANKAQGLLKELDTLVDAEYDKAKKENPKKAAKIIRQDAYQPEVDDEGKETGNIELSFKLKASGTSRSGQAFTQKPALVDGKGKPITKRNFKVGNGSEIAVAFEPIGYFMQSTNIASVSLRMKAVQIVNLIEYGDGSNFGFDTFDNGFDASAVTEEDDDDVNEDTDEETDEEDF